MNLVEIHFVDYGHATVSAVKENGRPRLPDGTNCIVWVPVKEHGALIGHKDTLHVDELMAASAFVALDFLVIRPGC
jgi:hypothetical protein